ncbi:MAG: hypothetical protein FD181_2954 [Prolixibacteraceae bacterium]|nr:MAG: hypothetical protein FD181_2954 [Prolixibacteraceae bacterium]
MFGILIFLFVIYLFIDIWNLSVPYGKLLETF